MAKAYLISEMQKLNLTFGEDGYGNYLAEKRVHIKRCALSNVCLHYDSVVEWRCL